MPSPSEPGPEAAHPQDAFCRNLLATKEHREAREWLTEGPDGAPRTIGEQSAADSRAIVDALYRDGAVDVQAVDIDRHPALGETTNILIVTLPADPGQRAKLFAYEARIARSEGFDPEGDQGQRLMFLFKFKLSPVQLLGQLVRGGP